MGLVASTINNCPIQLDPNLIFIFNSSFGPTRDGTEHLGSYLSDQDFMINLNLTAIF